MEIKKIINIVKDYMFVINIILGIYAFVILNKVSTVIEGNYAQSTKDTIYSVKTITEKLTTKGSFIYFEGKMISSGTKIRDRFSYDTSFPSEIFDGYLTEVKSSMGGTYFIWSSSMPTFSDSIQVQGWFFTDNISNFQTSEKNVYAQILYPVAEKKW